MPAKIKHIAIVSDQYALEGRFYEAVFGMKTESDTRPERAVTVSDGYVGLNINPRKAGRPAGLDHFGLEVEDAQAVCARLRERHPGIHVLKRPGNRPFAGISTHDPAGNVFDLSQQGMENRRDLYLDNDQQMPRRVGHIALRVVEPEKIAEFYRTVFDLTELEKPAGDANHYLSDGKVTLAIFPWQITDFEGSGIERPALDHIGFKVESMTAFKADLDKHTRQLAA